MMSSPDYILSIDGTDITPRIGARLDELTLSESRGDEADQLDITLDDSDARLAIPPRGARIALFLGWQGQDLIDKGDFIVDEVEHSGTPDQVSVRARSADMHRSLRQRTSTSWHQQPLGRILGDIAHRNGLRLAIDAPLTGRRIDHIDQTNESDLHFLTRLARQHDAVATVKKGQLIFRPIGAQRLPPVTISRQLGDQHRWHTAERTTYTGVRATWHDINTGQRRHVLAGQDGDVKQLKDTYATETDALEAARSELGRIDRGQATLQLTLAIGRPELMPQSPATVEGFKPEIDATDWLVVKVTHTLSSSQGYTTQIEMERAGAGTQPSA